MELVSYLLMYATIYNTATKIKLEIPYSLLAKGFFVTQ
jgi:hypothetical protein